jgi:hypothetical protein
MKNALSILALILLVSGFVTIVIGYSPSKTPSNQETPSETPPSNGTYPYTPPTEPPPTTPPPTEPPPDIHQWPPKWPPGYEPRSVFHLDVFGKGFDLNLLLVGIVMIVAGLVLMFAGGKWA